MAATFEQLMGELKQMDTTKPSVIKAMLDMSVHMESRAEALNCRTLCEKALTVKDNDNAIELIQLYWDSLRTAARLGDFDSFSLYIEKDRQAEARFYQPRRKALKTIVNALQDMLDNELDELMLSQPARTGKSCIINFFLCFIMGLDSEQSNLYCSYSDGAVSAMYKGILEIIDDPITYKLREVFPDFKLAQVKADDKIIDVGRMKKYPSLTCRSIDGSLNGTCDCQWFLIGDDLIQGIEEARSKERCDKKWTTVDNNFVTRATGKNVKKIWIGTRWSIWDPIGRRISVLENSPEFKGYRYKVINIPALDDNDESNFDYPNGKGLSTQELRRRRASFEQSDDMASWYAQYCGQPIEREGAVFPADKMRYYNGVLPKEQPDRIVAFCDVAWGGGDYLSMPVGFQFGEDVYVHDVVFDKSDKLITRPKVISMIMRYNIDCAVFEKNNGGGEYEEWIDMELKKRGYRCNMKTKSAPTTKRKENRIYDHAPEIMKNFIFLSSGCRSPEYETFMRNIYSFTVDGKNKHDDAPDSLSGLCDEIGKKKTNTFILLRE